MKKQGQENPFVIYGYCSPEYFCDREQETHDLIDAVSNGRNVTLLSPRRMGKTGLIQNAFHRLRAEGVWTPIYVDVFAARSLAEFVRRLGAAVIGSMDSNAEKALASATRFFRSFRPVLSVDPVTGAQSYSFTLDPANAEATLKECFDYLARDGRRAVVAIDEFQQIAEFPEKGTEALLRSYIQFLPHTRFIFAGSKRHLMAEMFSAPKRPFYNSTQMFPLGVIPRDAYFAFAERHMRAGGVALTRSVFDSVYGLFDGVTWYVQAVLNRLYGFRSAGTDDVARAVERIVAENAYYYGNLLETLPEGSIRLLKALAAEGKVREVTAGAFMARHGLHANSSVKISLVKLLDAGLVSRSDDLCYHVDDRFFALWLTRA